MDGRAATDEQPAWNAPSPLVTGTTTTRPWRPGLLALVLAVCLAPRIWDGFRYDVLWSDSLHYLRAAAALQHGDLHQAFDEFGLNIYPTILAGFARLGLDPVNAGRWWGIFIATAAVLPLWGWLRRQFDDRIALVACLCYALHGKLAAFSPLVMRDATFWFLFLLSLYTAWRAMAELRIGWFLAAGAALTLTVHTRTEGWLLVVPWIGWLAGRISSAAGARRRLVFGTLLGLAVLPVSLTVVNLTWLRAEPHWEMLRTQHLQIIENWWHSWHEPPRKSPPVSAVPLPVRAREPSADDAPPPVTTTRNPTGLWLDWKLAGRLIKAYGYIGGLLTLCGVLVGWRLLFRRDILPLAAMNLILLATIHIRYTQAGLDIRYFLPIVLVSLPWMAMGLFALAAWCQQFRQWKAQRAGRKQPPTSGGQRILYGLALLAAVGSLADGHLAAGRMMHRHVLAGQWIFAQFGPDQLVAENFLGPSLAAYYAQTTRMTGFDILAPGDVVLPRQIDARQARIVLLWLEDEDSKPRIAWAQRRLTARLGYRLVPPDRLPPGCDGVLVFEREGV